MRVHSRRAGRARRPAIAYGLALVAAMAAFLVVALGAAALFFLSSGSSNSAAASFIHAQPGSIRWDSRQRLTVLLMSVDSHLRRSPHADAMMVLSFEPRSNSVHLLSIPPNLWVTVPGFGQDVIGNAYSDGGGRLALLTAESVTHDLIPYYVVIDHGAFKQLVDALGGVGLPGVSRSPLAGGARTLHWLLGSQTDAQSGVVRMQREQELLFLLGSQIFRSQVYYLVPTIVNALSGSVPTNFPYNQVPALIRRLLAVPRSRVRGAMLATGNGTVTRYGPSGKQVLLPDWQNIEALAHGIIPPNMLRREGSVDVVNGSGVAGQAASLATWLQATGVRVHDITSAPTFTYRHTRILTRPGSGRTAHALAAALSSLLQIPVVRGTMHDTPQPVAVIIGHDFQDPAQQ